MNRKEIAMTAGYDAIVVGARCGGSPTAMLLAREGYRVLLVDKATFPSDTISTHVLHPPAVAALARWGILEQLEATGCPPIKRYSFDFGPVGVAGSPRAADGLAYGYGPRRVVLDALLVEAASAAGAEVREAFTVEEVVVEDGVVTGIRGHAKRGETVTERARVVVGADGKHSLVAKAVQPEQYNEAPSLTPSYYAYWSGLPTDGFETFIRAENDRGWGAIPTHDGLTCVVQGWPMSEFDANRKDIEGAYMKSFELAPEFAERIRAATRETRFAGMADLPGYFRKPYGQGWALVGDAGYHKHPITAFGITDAFRDAENLASSLDDAFAGRRQYDDAMAGCQHRRDDVAMPMYGLTCDFAKLEPPPPEMQQLIGAMQGNQEAMDDFVSVMAATLPAPEFFAPENAGRIVTQAGANGRLESETVAP
jgi:flavin-dependent dehydrogenase